MSVRRIETFLSLPEIDKECVKNTSENGELPLLTFKVECSYSVCMACCIYPRANGAKRRSGRKPGARVTNSASYSHPGKCEHSEVQSSSMIAGASLWFMGGPPH